MATMKTLNNYEIEDNAARTAALKGITTAGTGAAYTATVSGIATLSAGIHFTMVPHTVSTTTAPTLNVNGLGAKTIRRRISNSTSSTVAGQANNWLAANKPVGVTYDGSFWIVDFTQPNASDIYGTVPISKGGTGGSTDLLETNFSDESLIVGVDTGNARFYKRKLSKLLDWIHSKYDSFTTEEVPFVGNDSTMWLRKYRNYYVLTGEFMGSLALSNTGAATLPYTMNPLTSDCIFPCEFNVSEQPGSQLGYIYIKRWQRMD